VAALLAAHDFASFAIDYPLISQRPWPACGDACLAAAHFIQRGGLNRRAHLSRTPLFVLGASAGGHLALMTGLRLPGVAGVVSIAGIADLRALATCDWFAALAPEFFGVPEPTPAMWRAASPLHHVGPGLPPLLLTHDRHDEVVPVSQAEAFANAAAAVGAQVDLHVYNGPAHVMWRDPRAPQPQLLPEIETRLLSFLERCRTQRILRRPEAP
jgi:acetyl esterase/lipase